MNATTETGEPGATYDGVMKVWLPMVVALFAALATAQPPSSQALSASSDSVAWGSTVNGLRLGIAFGSEPSKPILRVVFQDVNGQDQEVLLGSENGKGPVYNLRFIAKARDGKVREGADLAAFYPVEGLVQPVSVVLSSVRKFELVFPLNNIIFSGRTDTLETVVKNGYSVRVSFEAYVGEPPLGGMLPRRWVGKLNSGELSPAR